MKEMDAGQPEQQLPDQEDVRCYVGVGASAGGVEALQELFQHMPLDTGPSFITVQHLSPDAVSLMDKILQKSSSLPVQLAKEGAFPKPNHIYLNHPGKTLTLKEVGSIWNPPMTEIRYISPLTSCFNPWLR